MQSPVQNFSFTAQPAAYEPQIASYRDSEASYVDAAGVVRFARPGLNWLSQSENIANIPWGKTGVTAMIPGDVTSPDGLKTANRVYETLQNSEHRFSRNLTLVKGQPVTVSIFLKAGTRSKVQLSFSNSATYTGGSPSVRFNLALGSFMLNSSNLLSYKAIRLNDGWYRLQITAIPDLGEATGFHLYLLSDNEKTIYAGEKDKYIYAWGAQLEPGIEMNPYTATGAVAYSGLRRHYNCEGTEPTLAGILCEPESENLIPYSEKFDSAAWKKQSCTTALVTATAPDGSGQSTKIKESAWTGGHHISPWPTLTISAGRTYTLSAYLKAAERKWAYFNVAGLTVHFDLGTGKVGNKNPVYQNVQMQKLPGGWYRCSATFLASGSEPMILIGPEKSNGDQSYTGDGNSGMLVWGVQLERGTELSSYIRTTGAKATRKADLVFLSPPLTLSSYDVLLQRGNAGLWQKGVSGNYALQTSIEPVSMVQFYDPREIAGQHEQIISELFPEKYVSIGER